MEKSANLKMKQTNLLLIELNQIHVLQENIMYRIPEWLNLDMKKINTSLIAHIYL